MDKLDTRALSINIQKINKDNEIETEWEFKDINTKFAFSKFVGASMYGTGNVSICGLDKSTLDELISFRAIPDVNGERKLIKVEVGYKNKKKALIIDGAICSATPTMPPDIWLNFEVLNGFELSKNFISMSIANGLTLEEYSKLIAKTLNLNLEMRIEDTNYLNKKMSGQDFAGSAYQLIQTIASAVVYNQKKERYGKVISYFENNTIIVDYSFLMNDDKRTKSPILINKNTGMVGLPEMELIGNVANITTLLKPEIKTGDVIKLESEQMKNANGLFYVKGITYTGEFRGNSWYSTFSCRRII